MLAFIFLCGDKTQKKDECQHVFYLFFMFLQKFG